LFAVTLKISGVAIGIGQKALVAYVLGFKTSLGVTVS